MSDALDPREFLEDFLIDAAEHLASLDDMFLELERRVEEGLEPDRGLVDELFRSMHTLKGMAGMMDFCRMAEIAHVLEQILEGVRQGQRSLAAPELPVLFAGLDGLKALTAQVRATGAESGVDTSDVQAALVGLAEHPRSTSPGQALLDRLDPHDQMAALVEVAKGARLFQLTVAPEHCPEGFASWHEGLGLIGKVYGPWDDSGEPVPPGAAESWSSLLLMIVTEADRQSVLDCSGLPELALTEPPMPWAERASAAVPAAVSARPAASAERASSIRVETDRLDRLMDLVGELVIHQTRLASLGNELAQALDQPGGLEPQRARLDEVAAGLDEAMQALAWVSDQLQHGTMKVRMVPVKALFNRFPRIVRDLARDCGKSARLVTEGDETELDKTVIEQIGDPLIHLLRNAVDHGLEPAAVRTAAGKPAEGVISLSAAQAGHHIVITVADDGQGIDTARVLAKARAVGLVGETETIDDQAVWQLIFKPGFSTAERVTSLSGRGVGMDVVAQNIQRLGGTIQIHSAPGGGTRFLIKLPLTLAITKALLVSACSHTFAIQLAAVEETLRLLPEEIRTMQGRELIQVRGQVLPVYRLGRLFAVEEAEGETRHLPTVVVGDGQQRLGLIVDALVGQQDVVVKSLGDFLGQPAGVGGATILGDGRVALILDIPSLLERHAAAPALT